MVGVEYYGGSELQGNGLTAVENWIGVMQRDVSYGNFTLMTPRYG